MKCNDCINFEEKPEKLNKNERIANLELQLKNANGLLGWYKADRARTSNCAKIANTRQKPNTEVGYLTKNQDWAGLHSFYFCV